MISVIIPAYNDLPGVLRAVNSLFALQTTQQIELIVQDDASPDIDFMGLVPLYASTVRNAQNLGFAGNCNAGAARAHGDLLLFLNQDCYGVHGWSNGWDAALLQHHDGKTVMGARLLFPDGNVQSCGGEFDAHGQPYHRNLAWGNPNHPEIAEGREVAWVTGAGLAIPRDVFMQIGGFSLDYPGGYFEDVDLCLQARELGCTVRYVPECTFIHSVGSTGGNPNFMTNAQTFRQKWVDTDKVERGYYVKENWW